MHRRGHFTAHRLLIQTPSSIAEKPERCLLSIFCPIWALLCLSDPLARRAVGLSIVLRDHLHDYAVLVLSHPYFLPGAGLAHHLEELVAAVKHFFVHLFDSLCLPVCSC